MAQINPNINAQRIKGHLELDAGTTVLAPLHLNSGSDVSSPTTGDIMFNGTRLKLRTSVTETIAFLSDIGSTSLTSTYVGYGSGANTLTGSSNFTYDGTTLNLLSDLEVASDSFYIQAGGVTDYSKSWYYGDISETSLGYYGNYMQFTATNSIIFVNFTQVLGMSASSFVFGNPAGSGIGINQTTESVVAVTTDGTGIKYFADYSANYTSRSLVDKAYADTKIGGSITVSQIGYGDTTANTIKGSSQLTWDEVQFKALGGYRTHTGFSSGSPYNVGLIDSIVFLTVSGDNAILPAADSTHLGAIFYFKMTDTNPGSSCTVTPTGNTIDGAGDITLLPALGLGTLNAITITYDGTEWKILASHYN